MSDVSDPDAFRNKIDAETRDRLDEIIHRESELGVYDLEAVLELGRHAI